jgi:hypothetical protein
VLSFLQITVPYTPDTTPLYHSHHTAKMSDQAAEEISMVTYEQLAGIEDEFEEIDTQISTPPNSLNPKLTYKTIH